MSHPYYLNKNVVNLLKEKMFDGISIIDCCCGFGEWGLRIRHIQETRKDATFLTGVDIYKPYIDALGRTAVYDRLYLQDINEFLEETRPLFNITLGIECIEHLEPEDGIRFLNNVDKACNYFAIITTPPKFIQTNNQDLDNKHNFHKSGGYKAELKKRNYTLLKQDVGLDIQFLLKNIYLRFRGRRPDAVSQIWIKEF